VCVYYYADAELGARKMPVVDELNLPIKSKPFAGPAIRAHKSRKEHNNNHPSSTSKMLLGYAAIRANLLKGIKALVAN
jgi:hypothetical protein